MARQNLLGQKLPFTPFSIKFPGQFKGFQGEKNGQKKAKMFTKKYLYVKTTFKVKVTRCAKT